MESRWLILASLFQGEKTSGQTKMKGMKLQEGRFWLKIEKSRMGRRCLASAPAFAQTLSSTDTRLLGHLPF